MYTCISPPLPIRRDAVHSRLFHGGKKDKSVCNVIGYVDGGGGAAPAGVELESELWKEGSGDRHGADGNDAAAAAAELQCVETSTYSGPLEPWC